MTWWLLVGLLLTGCMTMQGVIDDKAAGKGTARVYAVRPEVAFDAAVLVLRRTDGVTNVERDRTKGSLLAATNRGYIGVWIEPVSRTETKVTAVSRQIPPGVISETDLHKSLVKMMR